MELKRVIALDMRTANEKAIQLYGENVLVISSERVDNHTELIVAVDLPSLNEPTSTAPADDAVMSAAEFKKVSFAEALQASSRPEQAEEEEEVEEAEPEELAQELRALPDSPMANEAQHIEPQPSKVMPMAPTAAAVAVAQEERTHDALRSQEIVTWLREEFDALRRELLSARWQVDASGAQEWDEPYRSLAQALSSLGLPSGLRDMLMGELQGLQSGGTTQDLESTLQALESRLLSALKMPAAKGLRAGLQVLAGPSGAGKTSLISRLACLAADTHGPASQAIVSYRDTRPGAWSQLQTLAAQAGIDCYRATDEATFQVILAELSDRKTVWVDTPGLNYMDIAQSLKAQHPKVNLHAVLPVDATLTSAARVVVQAHGLWSSLMLTKLDEAAHPWPLMAALSEFPTPVSWVSSGTSQPLRNFEPQDLVHSALAPLKALPISAQASPTADTASFDAATPAPALTPQPPKARPKSVAKKASTKTSAAPSKVVARMTPRSTSRARAHA